MIRDLSKKKLSQKISKTWRAGNKQRPHGKKFTEKLLYLPGITRQTLKVNKTADMNEVENFFFSLFKINGKNYMSAWWYC